MQMVKRIIDLYGLDRVNDKVNGVTALHSAVAKGSLEMVKLLIENGASPNAKIGKTLKSTSSFFIGDLRQKFCPGCIGSTSKREKFDDVNLL